MQGKTGSRDEEENEVMWPANIGSDVHCASGISAHASVDHALLPRATDPVKFDHTLVSREYGSSQC